MTAIPLVIDLDGTLTRTDMLHESAVRVLCDRPLEALAIPYWLWQGKAVLKKNLAERACFDAASLPYDRPFLDWLTTQRAQGRQLVLCTASDAAIATKIAGHLGLFDEVMASDGVLNLAGAHKAQALVQRFGRGGFDYAGNSQADLAVWQCARHAIVVNASDKLTRQAAACCHVEQVFAPPTVTPALWSRMLRVHQWLKNLLLFVPLVAAHQITQPQHWLTFILAFVAFSICASSVYIANDLFDLESDRQHPRKCKRPFASGLLPIWLGVLLAPLLLALSICLAVYVGKLFLFWLGFYFVLTCAYSWLLKRLMLLDCLTLAMLYTLRVIAGASAADMPLSFWLLAFSVFLFLSLAFVKRYAELQIHAGIKKKLH
ncbi:MAG: UbiA family prenyltransferase, partial [Methylovulum sp.]|nr:UbiA family prenyltransferase [Methylovulum sp.]